MNVLLIYLTNLFYRYNKKITNVEILEQTASFNVFSFSWTPYERNRHTYEEFKTFKFD